MWLSTEAGETAAEQQENCTKSSISELTDDQLPAVSLSAWDSGCQTIFDRRSGEQLCACPLS
jgi:hypothetical protein